MYRTVQNAGNINPSCSGLFISNSRLLIYVVYCVTLAGGYALVLGALPDPSQTESVTLAFAIGAVVPSCAIFRREVDLLEPMYWFSAMYFAFFIGAVYFILTDFQYAQHNLISDPTERSRVLFKSLSLILIGYLMFLGAYLVATMRCQRARIDFNHDDRMPDWLIGSAVVALLALGLANFIYLVANYPGGLLKYYSEMGLRAHRLEAFGEGTTTAGLQLIYAAVWLWLFILMRNCRRGIAVSNARIAIFVITATISAAILASQGRLFQTISYALALAGMAYAFSTNVGRNSKMLIGGAVLILAGLGLFFGRLLSLLIFNRPDVFASLVWSVTIETFLRALNYFVLDAGNVTDLTSFMNVVAYWEQDSSYLYGTSFLSPLSRFIPGVELQGIAEMSQHGWSTNTGALPPTFVGELYANFGVVGVIGGMLVAGFVIGRVYIYCARRGNFWMTLILSALTFRFFFVLPKGETVNLVGAVWLILPAIATFAALKIIYLTARRPG